MFHLDKGTPEDGKSGRRNRGDEESEVSDDGASDGEDRPRKRGRPRIVARDNIKGFTDVEIRRFLKSFRKFPAPLKRLDAVAGDAEVQEKPLTELTKLGELILHRCQEALASQKSGKDAAADAASMEDSQTATGRKKRERGPSFKVSNVSVNAKTLMACLNELEPLAHLLPANVEERRRWVLDSKVRDPHWDIDWTTEDDSRLMCGIYEYGMGSWEAMKMDPNLGLADKILPDGHDAKPQAKHLQTRSDYLLKIMGKRYETQQGQVKPKRQRKPREVKPVSKAVVDAEDISSADDIATSSSNLATSVRGRTAKNKANAAVKTEDEDSHDPRTEDERHLERKSTSIASHGIVESVIKKEKRKKKDTGPMHFTANSEPRAVDIIGDLDPAIFNEVIQLCCRIFLIFLNSLEL